MTLKTLAAAGLAVAFACLALGARAVEPYQEYRKHIEGAQTLTALTDELMGDSVSLYNGATEFVVTDIDLPGNNSLPVRLSRRFSVAIIPGSAGESTPGDPNYKGLGNWDIDIPYVASTWAQGPWADARCSTLATPDPPGAIDPLDVWHGIDLHIPGAGDRKLLSFNGITDVPRPTDGVTYRWTTRERDMVSCIPMKSGLSGEGFLLKTADGIKYYFDVATTRDGGRITIPYSEYWGMTVSTARVQYYLLASKVEDRFGNTVNYTYNASGFPDVIQSSDGRKITLAYASGRLTSATAVDADPAKNRTWSYGYGTSGDNAGMLTSVTRPDTSRWTYTHTGTLRPWAETWDGNTGPNCNGKPPPVQASFVLSATHPSGATGTFEFGNYRHPRSGIHLSACAQRTSNSLIYYKLMIPNYYDVMSLHEKTISGPGLTARTWTYSYPYGSAPLWGGGAPAYPCTSCPQEKVVTVREPDSTIKQYRYGYLYAVNEGRLLSTTTLDANGVVRRVETTEYVSETEAPAQNFYGTRGLYGIGFGTNEPSTLAIRPVIARMITQDGTDFIWAVAQGCGGTGVFCFDEFARPTKVIKTSLAAATGDVVRPSGVPVLTAPDATSTGSYSVTWTTVTFANRYEFQERLGSGTWATVQSGAGTSMAFSNKANGSWSYQVRACNAIGCAGWSLAQTVEVAVPPASAPTLTAPATNTTGSYSVSWTPVARATRYELDQNWNGSGWGPMYNGPGTSAGRSGMVSGTYQYRVRACNTGGCGPYSAIATTVVNRTSPAPPAPTNLTAPGQVDIFTAFNVSWSASSGATGYRLERNKDNTGWSLAYEGSARIVSESLRQGTYVYRVQACNDGGCGLYSSGATVVVKPYALAADEANGE
jgi:hypothetical protein